MIDRFRSLDRYTRWVILLAVGFVLFRIGIASLSGFGFHQGWNEGHYALIADGFLDHPLVPRYGDNYVYNVPPLFPYSVAASFALFGESVLAARLPSILATGGLIIATYYLGREVFENRSTAFVGTVVLATLPYVQLYGGRAQTDMLMVFFLTASLTAIIRGYQRETQYRRWIIIGAALFAAAVASKQPAVALSGVVFFWLLVNRRFDSEDINRTLLLIGSSIVFLLPLFGWFYLNYTTAPVAFVADWEHELFSRTRYFANIPLLLTISFGLGVTLPVFVSNLVGVFDDVYDTLNQYRSESTEQSGPSVLVWWLVLYSAFVFARTPHGHQYYAVVLTPPIALLSAQGLQTTVGWLCRVKKYDKRIVKFALLALLLVSTIAGTVVLFELSGEFSASNGKGTYVAADAGEFAVGTIPENATILVPNGYVTPIKWYTRNHIDTGNIKSYQISSSGERRLQTVINSSERPIYVFYPSPSWGKQSSVAMNEIHITTAYEYTIMSYIGNYVETDSKFTFYLTDRRLIIYRVKKVDTPRGIREHWNYTDYLRRPDHRRPLSG